MRGRPYRGNIRGGTINTKPSVLDYHREQVAVKDKERKSERKWQERWQMAAELNASVLSSSGTGRKREENIAEEKVWGGRYNSDRT